MTNTTGEINALLNLIEDPDDEVYQTITKRFIGFGQDVIPVLNEFQELTDDPVQVAKINSIISQISISCLENAVSNWLEAEDQSVLEASLFIAAYLHPEYDRDRMFFEVEKIRKTIWLELNDYLTPLEEINILNKIIFGHYNYKGVDLDHASISHFDTSHLLPTRFRIHFPWRLYTSSWQKCWALLYFRLIFPNKTSFVMSKKAVQSSVWKAVIFFFTLIH